MEGEKEESIVGSRMVGGKGRGGRGSHEMGRSQVMGERSEEYSGQLQNY